MEVFEGRRWRRLQARFSLDLSLGESYIYDTARAPGEGRYYAINVQSGRAGVALPGELGAVPGEAVEVTFEAADGCKIAAEQAAVERGGSSSDMIEAFIQDDSRGAELIAAAAGGLPVSMAIMRAAAAAADMQAAGERGPGRPQRIVVAGGSGFIGSRLVERLAAEGGRYRAVTCLMRNPATARARLGNNSRGVRFVKADLSRDVSGVLGDEGADVAYYLVHSMERSSRGGSWKEFAWRDREVAENFAAAAARWGVRMTIYLGGLHREGARLSEHMASRSEVGQILARSSGVSVTTFRAAVIIGWGGGSFEMLRYLVERLPRMVCPR